MIIERVAIVELSTPRADGLDAVVRCLAAWQRDTAPLQLHPGDLGWFWRSGADATAAAFRTWHDRDGRTLAIGLLDGPRLLRLTVAPEAWRDAAVARQVVEDVADPARGVLPAGAVSVEAPRGSLVADLLLDGAPPGTLHGARGWDAGEPWTPLRRDLAAPVLVVQQEDDPARRLRVEPVDPRSAPLATAVHRSAFPGSTFDDAHWDAMASGLPFRDARCLLGFDPSGRAVATVTVWSAGPGRPGLLEPMGVHADHRGRGYGTAICLAAAAALRDLGASAALVCTPSANTAAIATYAAAGFAAQPERRDRTRRPAA